MPRRDKTRCRKKRLAEVLRSYHGLSNQQALRLIKRNDRWVTTRCRRRQPATLLAHDLVRLDRATARDPSHARRRLKHETPGRSTVVQGRRVVGIFTSRALALAAAKRYVNSTERPVLVLTPNPAKPTLKPPRHALRRTPKRSRDKDHPFVGEVFETKAGQRWEIVTVSDKRISVRRLAPSPKSPGPFVWGRESLKPLKTVDRFKLEEEKRKAAQAPAKEPERGLFGFFGGPVAPDPDGGGGRRKGKAHPRKGAARKRVKGPRSEGAQCSDHAVLARKRMLEAGDRPPHAGKGPSRVQTLIFERHCWTVPMAKAWAQRHGYRVTKTDKTATEIRIRQRAPSTMRIVGSMPFKRGLRAVLGFVKRKRRKT